MKDSKFRKILVGIGVIVGIYLGIGLIVDAVVAGISEETEASWFGDLEFGGTQPGSAEERAQFAKTKAIFDRLLADGTLRPLPYQLHWVDSSVPNAFAVPGGSVAVTDGLLELVESEAGLAFVLAHELGHQQLRHSLRRLGRSLAYHILLNLFLGAEQAALLGTGVEAAQASYSRDQERDADRFGLKLVRRVLG
ncbi:MAG: M48 family metallopeptidase, partial [Planctomycetota bacterium]